MNTLPNETLNQLAKKIMATVENIIILLDAEGIIRQFNPAAEKLTGYHAEDLIGHAHWSMLVPEDERPQVFDTFNQLKAGDFPNTRINHWVTQNGQTRSIKWNNSVITDADGKVQYVVATGTDITEQVETNEYLAISAKAMESGEGLIITDKNGVIIRTNRTFSEVTGYREEEVIGKTPRLFSSGQHDAQFYEAMWEGLSERGFWSGEIWNKRKNGEIYPEYLKISAVYDDHHEVTHYVASFSDISKIKNAERQVQYLANYDFISGLPNRTYFIKLLRTLIDKPHKSSFGLVVLHIRLHKLSKLNTQLGISTTDQMLTQFTQRLTELLNQQTFIAGRTSGSDFTIVIEHPKSQNLVKFAQEQAEKIIQTTQTLNHSQEHEITDLDPRIGIVLYPSAEEEDLHGRAETLLEHGLLSSFEAIDQGLKYHFYSEESQKIAQESYKLEQALSRAIQDMEEFELYHQPQFNNSHQITGGEVLIRWKHNGSYVPPNVFIPFAESAGLMPKIGHWVLKKAIEQIVELQEQGLLAYYSEVSVNISPKQLVSENFISDLKTLIAPCPWVAEHLKLEITETAFIEDIALVKQQVSAIREMGMKLSIDDFGTGYSSLSYLTELEFDELKIDKSFIDHVHIRSHKAHKITVSILGIVRALEVRVVAEGVETQEQLSTLADLGCQYFQGYLLSQPKAFNELIQELTQLPHLE
ncbi:EAL domain-containing protein [Thiomicrorhabdus sp. zzn3]|uniref:sensor domain-containing protein n=1 Tax=Thiomicrorhabdus sp. zzn3 TaxID=3039775 RepID=UPI0024373D51|nr:bifunctional diguanylate cyclase/phosphodiesterase [Thiomicrorhabdus sp. zzn3]MDG6778604.1 EAL domain-containing protein [Thiomicrorhabdus sp. zzn3]